MRTDWKKRGQVGIELLLLIGMVFAFAYIIQQSDFVSAATGTQCCEQTKTGAVCQNVQNASVCADDAQFTSSNCEKTSYCKLGCCIDEVEGTFDKNVPQMLCTGANSNWESQPNCDVVGAELGCCVLGGETSYVTNQRCSRLSDLKGLPKNYLADLGEADCVALADLQIEGACVFPSNRGCEILSQSECISKTGSSQTFFPGYLCTAPVLNTTCENTKETSCFVGEDEVYYLDSCGNKANIYDSAKYDDEAYWSYIYLRGNTCNPTTGNANSESCGACNRFLGSTCASAAEFGVTPDFGDFFCKPTSCMYDGKEYKNGESWCVYDGKIGEGDDIVGSRHWKYICNNGEMQIEPCADARNEICVEEESSVGNISIATCKPNNWRECVTKDSGCNKILDCETTTVTIDKFVKTACTPKYPEGFGYEKEDRKTAQQICGKGSATCVAKYKKACPFCPCKCYENCDCEEEIFTQQMNDLCVSLGDCGAYVNTAGRVTTGGCTVDGAPMISAAQYISRANPDNFKGQKGEVGDIQKYLDMAGITTGGYNNLMGPGGITMAQIYQGLATSLGGGTATSDGSPIGTENSQVSGVTGQVVGGGITGRASGGDTVITTSINPQQASQIFTQTGGGAITTSNGYSLVRFSSMLESTQLGIYGGNPLGVQASIFGPDGSLVGSYNSFQDAVSALNDFGGLTSASPSVTTATPTQAVAITNVAPNVQTVSTTQPATTQPTATSQPTTTQPTLSSSEVISYNSQTGDWANYDLTSEMNEFLYGEMTTPLTETASFTNGFTTFYEVPYNPVAGTGGYFTSNPIDILSYNPTADIFSSWSSSTGTPSITLNTYEGSGLQSAIQGWDPTAGYTGKWAGGVEQTLGTGGIAVDPVTGLPVEGATAPLGQLSAAQVAQLAGFIGGIIGGILGGMLGGFIAKALGMGKIGGMLMQTGMGILGGMVGMGVAVGIATGGNIGEAILAALLGNLNPIFTVVGIGMIIASFFFGAECPPVIVTFTCSPWKRPSGGSDCEKCNGDPLKPCSEYRCKSLGATCELINRGTSQEMCVAKGVNDASAPTIEPVFNMISNNTKVEDAGGDSFRITNLDGGCINAYDPIYFTIETNEPAICKFDVAAKNFDEMSFDLSAGSYEYQHVVPLLLPEPRHSGAFGGNWTGDMTLYIKCQDQWENTLPGFYTVETCVTGGEDVTPVRINAAYPDMNGGLIAYNKTQQNVFFFTNEPADCRWSLTDKDYDLMENSVNCMNDVIEMQAQGYLCNTTLPISSSENKFYVRCKDQPWITEGNGTRNANSQSFEYTLKKPEAPLTIVKTAPNGTKEVDAFPSAVDLRVETSGGGELVACTYSFESFNDSNAILFYETLARYHSQELNLGKGIHKIYVVCGDETGDLAQKEVEFELYHDSQSPQISRIFNEGGVINIVTTESAECSYSTSSCMFDFAKGESAGGNIEHIIRAKGGTKYYVKCRDQNGNEPSTCSVIVQAA